MASKLTSPGTIDAAAVSAPPAGAEGVTGWRCAHPITVVQRTMPQARSWFTSTSIPRGSPRAEHDAADDVADGHRNAFGVGPRDDDVLRVGRHDPAEHGNAVDVAVHDDVLRLERAGQLV